MKEYLKKIDYDNNKAFAYYGWLIKWIPHNIIDDDEKNGYIVQKVRFLNTTEIDINEEKNNDMEYYEAWKVENQKVVNTEKTDHDDAFIYGYPYDFSGSMKKSLGKNGEIKYFSQVYWISEKNYLYNIVDQWIENTVKMSGGLKSTYVKDCPELEKCKPIFKRDDFVHKVTFSEKDDIKKAIYETFKKRIEKKDEDVLNILYEIFENTDYIDIFSEIKQKYYRL